MAEADQVEEDKDAITATLSEMCDRCGHQQAFHLGLGPDVRAVEWTDCQHIDCECKGFIPTLPATPGRAGTERVCDNCGLPIAEDQGATVKEAPDRTIHWVEDGCEVARTRQALTAALARAEEAERARDRMTAAYQATNKAYREQKRRADLEVGRSKQLEGAIKEHRAFKHAGWDEVPGATIRDPADGCLYDALQPQGESNA